MDENEAIKRGFNDGYMLEKYHPKLARQLEEGLTDKNDSYSLGFLKGRQESMQDSFFDEAAPQDFSDELSHEQPDRGQDLDRQDKGRDDGPDL